MAIVTSQMLIVGQKSKLDYAMALTKNAVINIVGVKIINNVVNTSYCGKPKDYCKKGCQLNYGL